MLTYYEVRPITELGQSETDRYIEVKTATLGYFEAQIIRDRADGTHFDAASLFAAADANEADTLLLALQSEMPKSAFEIVEKKSESGTRFQPQMI